MARSCSARSGRRSTRWRSASRERGPKKERRSKVCCASLGKSASAMSPTTRAFLDTSALFAAIWSEEGGGRMLLRLGEAGAVQIVVSRQVLAGLERALRSKAPHPLGSLAVLLDRIHVEVAPGPSREGLRPCEPL